MYSFFVEVIAYQIKIQVRFGFGADPCETPSESTAHTKWVMDKSVKKYASTKQHQ